MTHESKTVLLKPFEEEDFQSLSLEIESPRFILQWAGPKYTFPLTWGQLEQRSREEIDGKKSIYIFKALDQTSLQTIGFIELAVRDFVRKVANVESVLVFKKYRGQGYGRSLMSAIVRFGFQELEMNELTLSVFDFNYSAIACYQSLGFRQYEIGATPRSFENEKWGFVRMTLCRER